MNKAVNHIQSNTNLQRPKWAILQSLWTGNSIQFLSKPEGYYIQEFIEETIIYQLRRDHTTNQRYTNLDYYGLLGLSLIDTKDSHCILTEGVSDYFSAKLLNPNTNVLGVTALGGSKIAKSIIANLFSSIELCIDRDTAGMNTAKLWRNFLSSHNITSKIILTESPNHKDITDEFLYNLKIHSSYLLKSK